jgi:DNA invertase Pin-like site-specific DNA recombinase
MATRTLQTTPARHRCAIYTRKSTEEGLDQEFNTLDAQLEAGEAYIQSQKTEGWEVSPTRYDDGGYTGANTERPALQRLMADIKRGQIDVVVVYKIDRFSRSLLDFAKLIEVFEQYKVSLVAVTQQFNTSTSLGRLVLNILLSFAQFEREMIAERTRDKMRAAPQGKVDWRCDAVWLRRQRKETRGQRGGNATGAGAVRHVPRTPFNFETCRACQRFWLAREELDDEEGHDTFRWPVDQKHGGAASS